ncbi:MAG: ABC transporter permease subunit, partial [Thermotogae bacterium]|nr:ABC transporter permease subunit [Thermotogota bacterium]
IRITRTALENLPTDIEEAAISLGASKLKAFFLTVLPNIKTGIIASFILMFIISFNNVPISLFLTGPGVNMLPIVMMSYMEYYYDPSIAALSTLLILLTFGIVILSQKLLGITRYM